MKIFLSPSTKDYIISPITQTTESAEMRKLSDIIKAELETLGIETKISREDSVPSENVAESNNEEVDLHITLQGLHSKNSPKQGIIVYYNSADGKSKALAETFSENLKEIYPRPDLVTIQGDSSSVELLGTNAPSLILSLGNLSDKNDAEWFSENIEEIGKNIALSINESITSQENTIPMTALGLIKTSIGYTEVRKSPSATSRIIARIQNGAPVRIIGKIGKWYAIIAANIEGYIPSEDVTAETPEQ